MSLQQFIVSFLNRKPLELDYTAVQFDQLPPNQLLQLLSDILSHLFQIDKYDIRRESAEDTTYRIFNCLRILRYRPPTDAEELEEWRAGIVDGSKSSIYPVLIYIVENFEMLTERAYLSNFLMKVDVPSDVHDYDTAEIQEQIAELSEEFKEIHAENSEIQQDLLIMDDIKMDLKSMESEKELLLKKIEKASKRVSTIPNHEKVLEFASQLRVEKERLSDLNHQKQQERMRTTNAENREARHQEILEELHAVGETINMSEMLGQLEEEFETNQYIVTEKLAVEIKEKEERLEELFATTRTEISIDKDLAKLEAELSSITEKIQKTESERDKEEEPLDENMSILRHQAIALTRKKAGVAEKLQNIRQNLAKVEEKISKRQSDLEKKIGHEVITTAQFRKFVEQHREKIKQIRKNQYDMDEYLCEEATLERTREILEEKMDMLVMDLESMGIEVVKNQSKPGGPRRPKTSAPKTDNVEELRQLISDQMNTSDKLRDEISEETKLKQELGDSLRKKKEDYDLLTMDVTERKEDFNRSNGKLIAEARELEQEKREIEDDHVLANDEEQSMKNDLENTEYYENENFESLVTEMKRDALERLDQLEYSMSRTNRAEDNKKQMIMLKSLKTIFSEKVKIAKRLGEKKK